MFMKYGLPLVALVCLGFAIVHVSQGQKPDPPSAPLVAPPRTPFTSTVAGSGLVEPRTENIAVGSPVPGLVVEVLVRVGQWVEPGAPLFRLDDRQLQAELRSRQAALAAANAEFKRLENLPRPEELPVAEALVLEADASRADQADQLRRARELEMRRVITEQELFVREQAYRIADARYLKAKGELDLLKAGSWQYDRLIAQGAVDQARAQVEQTQTELDRLVIRAQVGSEVLKINVRPGEFVATPSNQALLFLGDIKQLHARVDIDEHDIPRFRPGSAARATLKGHADMVFPLRFVRVEPYVVPKRSLTGENTERVDTRVLQVIYAIDPGPYQLYVGQQLDVFIEGDGAVPTAAAK